MLTRKTVNIAGIVGLLIMLALFALMYFRVVPERMYLMLGLIALAVFLVRIAMRMMLARQERIEHQGEQPAVQQDPPADEEK